MFSLLIDSAILFSKLNFDFEDVVNLRLFEKSDFKLILDRNVTEQTYPKISCRSQKCSVQSQNQQFYLVK